jgi:hypothetical protein
MITNVITRNSNSCIRKKMMKCFICSLFFLVVSPGCQSRIASKPFTAALPHISACIQQKIDSIKQQPVWNPPAEINEYAYGDRQVYLISAPCCDFFSVVVDSNCNYICAPVGGFTGKGDRKCVDFLEKAEFVRLIWKEERGKK